MNFEGESLALGLYSNLLKKGKVNLHTIKQCAELSHRGSASQRTAAHFRGKIMHAIWKGIPDFDGAFRAMYQSAPTVGEDASEEETVGLSEMLIGDIQEGGDSMTALQEYFGQCVEWVKTTAQEVQKLLLQTYDVEKRDHSEITYRMLEVALACNMLLSHRAREIEGRNDSVKSLGLNGFFIAELTASVEASILRILLQNGLDVRDAVKDVTGQSARFHINDKSFRESFEESILIAQNCMKAGLEDAEAHAVLSANPPSNSLRECRVQPAPAPEAGLATLNFRLQDQVYRYSFARSSHHNILQESIGFPLVLLNDGDKTSDPFLSVHAEHNSFYLSHQCAYATLDSALLPQETLETVAHALEIARSRISEFFSSQPLIAKNLPFLGSISIHEKEHSVSLEIPMTHAAAYRQLAKGEQVLSAPDDIAQKATLTLIPQTSNGVVEEPSNGETVHPAREALRECYRKHMQFGELDALLGRIGVEKIIGEGKGSHTKYYNPDSGKSCVLSRRFSSGHTVSVPVGIIADLLNRLVLSAAQFETFLCELDRKA